MKLENQLLGGRTIRARSRWNYEEISQKEKESDCQNLGSLCPTEVGFLPFDFLPAELDCSYSDGFFEMSLDVVESLFHL